MMVAQLLSKNLVILVVALASLQLTQSFTVPSALNSYNGRLQKISSLNRISASHNSDSSLKSTASAWKSVVSTNADLNVAVDEIIEAVSVDNAESIKKYNLAIFFTSSIYEASAFKYDELFETLSKKMPGMKTMIGCTTGNTRIYSAKH